MSEDNNSDGEVEDVVVNVNEKRIGSLSRYAFCISDSFYGIEEQ